MSWAEVKMAIKKIQRGYATVTNADVTITLPKSVNPERCLVLLDGNAGAYQGTASNNSNAYVFGAGGYNNTTEYYQMVGISTQSSYRYMSAGYNISGTPLSIPSVYAIARKPYVKALTSTQLTIGQSGTYSNGNNGTTVSYQVIEFFS